MFSGGSSEDGWLFYYYFALIAAIGAAMIPSLNVWPQGNVPAYRGTTDGELYSYTIAMLLVSLGLLFYAVSKRSSHIRKAAIVGIGLTIAKVFLIDMAGLTGLTGLIRHQTMNRRTNP